MERIQPRFQRTYEELKPAIPERISSAGSRFQRTYEELKHTLHLSFLTGKSKFSAYL